MPVSNAAGGGEKAVPREGFWTDWSNWSTPLALLEGCKHFSAGNMLAKSHKGWGCVRVVHLELHERKIMRWLRWKQKKLGWQVGMCFWKRSIFS